jgi:hypothetical protein
MEPFLFILLSLIALALIVLGAIWLSRVQAWLNRAIAIVAIATGALMVLTLVIGGLVTSRIMFPEVSTVLLAGIAVAALVFWATTLADCALNESKEGNDKLVWVLIIIFTQFPGALIYRFARRPKRLVELGQ